MVRDVFQQRLVEVEREIAELQQLRSRMTRRAVRLAGYAGRHTGRTHDLQAD